MQKWHLTLSDIFLKIKLKYLEIVYRLNSFKEITISFNHGLQMTLESPASLSDSHLV